ncbi:uncharacterized protein [Drosophila pseudoobscura]|uniref:Uncharacterized protein n=1 Tax=Drosophila pseudoobscura pseudoobscura TaxID=46245 RepID=A0A6I8VYM9_DROPS|nr:uncharacterized protein LOC117183978 [Drosophila pseudoobscura]
MPVAMFRVLGNARELCCVDSPKVDSQWGPPKAIKLSLESVAAKASIEPSGSGELLPKLQVTRDGAVHKIQATKRKIIYNKRRNIAPSAAAIFPLKLEPAQTARQVPPVKEEELKSFAVDFDNKDEAPAVGPLAPPMRCRSATPPPLTSRQSRCPILMMPIASRAGGTGATKSSCRIALEGDGHPAEDGNIAGQSGAEGSGHTDHLLLFRDCDREWTRSKCTHAE